MTSEQSLDVIALRLTNLETGQVRIEGEIASLRKDSFVGIQLYDSEQKAQNDRIDSALKAAYLAVVFSISIGLAAVFAIVAVAR